LYTCAVPRESRVKDDDAPEHTNANVVAELARSTPLCLEPIPLDLMRQTAMQQPSIGHLNPPFMRRDDVTYHAGESWVLEMFLDASRLKQMANLLGDVTTIAPVRLNSRLDPHLWGGVVPFKFITRNSRVAMAHYEFSKANCKRLHGTDMGDAQVRVVLTISDIAVLKALVQRSAIFDLKVDGIMFLNPITPEYYDDFKIQETQVVHASAE
jgi:hypothetical protein